MLLGGVAFGGDYRTPLNWLHVRGTASSIHPISNGKHIGSLLRLRNPRYFQNHGIVNYLRVALRVPAHMKGSSGLRLKHSDAVSQLYSNQSINLKYSESFVNSNGSSATWRYLRRKIPESYLHWRWSFWASSSIQAEKALRLFFPDSKSIRVEYQYGSHWVV